jgi:uncharacterized damage-inducible protein DinB
VDQTRKVLLKTALGLAREDLDEVIDHLNQEMMAWSPVEGMHTIAWQLFEIAVTEHQRIGILKEDRWIPDEEAQVEFGDCKSFENLQQVLKSVRQGTLDYIDSLSDEELASPHPSRPAWFRESGPAIVPRYDVIRRLADHESYHVGQLTTYLWARGDNPYEW